MTLMMKEIVSPQQYQLEDKMSTENLHLYKNLPSKSISSDSNQAEIPLLHFHPLLKEDTAHLPQLQSLLMPPHQHSGQEMYTQGSFPDFMRFLHHNHSLQDPTGHYPLPEETRSQDLPAGPARQVQEDGQGLLQVTDLPKEAKGLLEETQLFQDPGLLTEMHPDVPKDPGVGHQNRAWMKDFNKLFHQEITQSSDQTPMSMS